MVGKKKIQPNPNLSQEFNPTQSMWIGLDPWVRQFFFLITIIIIKLSIRITPPQLRTNL